ncbi:MAG: helix-turn-helix transcriptional regulator [Actinomycetota bacterium]|nr:helix-turn-helix transcriptional regulator [Actinomycetota bacterium]
MKNLYCGMRGKRPVDEVLKKEFGQRFKALVDKTPLSKVANQLDNIVSPVTLWDYVNGQSLPGPVVLKKIAEFYNVTVDYLLSGQQPLFPVTDMEKKFFNTMREAEALGIAEQAEHFVRIMIEQKKQAETNSGMESKASENH